MQDSRLTELKQKLAEEEEVYAELLARIDELAAIPTAYAVDRGLPTLLKELNAAWNVEPTSTSSPSSGLKGLARAVARRFIEPEMAPLRASLARQRSFNSVLVQFLNRYAEVGEQRSARFSELASAIVRFAQRIDRLADAKDRLYATLSGARTDFLLESMGKRLETASMALKRAETRLEGLTTSIDLARTEIRSLTAPDGFLPAPAAPLAPHEYVSFENRYRGSTEEIRERLRFYVSYFRERTPVLELGSGRGEFLDLLRESGIAGHGVDDNREMVRTCRERGLDVGEGNLVEVVARAAPESLGGVFAAQVIEHLPPLVLREVLQNCHRVLRKGGCLVVETVNPRSVLALVESFNRDLTHQKPLHPDTIDFLLRASGFNEVTIEYRSPVAERAKLVPIPREDEAAQTLNENLRKLNALLFGDQDYAAIAVK